MQDRAHTQVDDFLRYLRSERRASPHTLSSYRRDLATLRQFCDDRKLTAWNELTVHHARAYVGQLHRSGLSGKSIQRALSAARSLFRYLLREKAADNNPLNGISAPKTPKRLPDTLSVDQTVQLVAIPVTDPLSRRDRAIMELMYSSGLRLAELVSLDVPDVDLRDEVVRVTGKGAKTRVIPVGRQAREALSAWLPDRAALVAVGEPALFVGRNGRRAGSATAHAAMGRAPGHGHARASAHAAPFICQSPAGVQRRSARGPGTPRTRGYLHHPDLHPSGFSALGQGVRSGPSPGAAQDPG